MVCTAHGAKAPQVAARAAIRAEIEGWGLGHVNVDPGETLLRLLSQSVWRANRYAAEIERLVGEHRHLSDALVGDQYVMSDDGALQRVGEYIKGMAVLENQERDRAAKFSQLAIAAGLAERQVKLAERSGAMIADVLERVFTDLGLTAEQRAAAPAAIQKAITA